MAGVCMLAAVSGHYRFGLIAAGRQKDEMLTSALGAGTALILIPVGYTNSGTGGAAAALFIAESVTLASAWYLARRQLFNSRSDDAARLPTNISPDCPRRRYERVKDTEDHQAGRYRWQ